MANRDRMLAIGAAVLFGVAGAGCQRVSSVAANHPATASSSDQAELKAAACYETPLWGHYGVLFLRAEREKCETLLLTRLTPEETLDLDYGARHGGTPGQVIYRYRPGAPELEVATREDWERAKGVVVDSEKPAHATSNPLTLDFETHTLRRIGAVVPTSGPFVLSLNADPSGEFAAVLSADGPVRDTRLFILGGFGTRGQHYHQVLRRSDGVPAGDPMRLPYRSDQETVMTCWSSDSRYVLYIDYDFSRLCIIATGLTKGERP